MGQKGGQGIQSNFLLLQLSGTITQRVFMRKKLKLTPWYILEAKKNKRNVDMVGLCSMLNALIMIHFCENVRS